VRWGTVVITGAEHLNLLPPGLLSVVELSAQSVIYEVSVVAFMVNDGGLGFRSGSLGSVPAQIQRKLSSNQLHSLHLPSPCSSPSLLLPPLPME